MKDAQKPGHISLNVLINHIREGQYVIPDFQRDFEWVPRDINALMSSIFRDYYIGSLLLWKGTDDNFSALACEPIYGFEAAGNPVHIVLDGQQRLTAMHYAFMAPDASAPNRYNRYLFFIRVDRFMDESFDEAFEYDWRNRGVRLFRDRTAQFESHMFPVALVGSEGWELYDWIKDYEAYWKQRIESSAGNELTAATKHAENASAFGKHIKEITEQYQISFIELDQRIELDKVCDIFTQINSRGIRLDVFDLINALLRPKGLQLRRKLWRDAAPRLSYVNSPRMDVYVLQVMSILRQQYCSPKYLYYLLPGQPRSVRQADGTIRSEVLVPDVGEFERLWLKAVGALEAAMKLLGHPQEFGAVKASYLPYTSILPAFAALQEEARQLPFDRRLAAQHKIRSWYWASVFTNRYSGSVESTSARDYSDVKAWILDSGSEPRVISEFREEARGLELERETRKGTSVYNGVFNLLIMQGARDWITGTLPQSDDIDDHHICASKLGPEEEASDND